MRLLACALAVAACSSGSPPKHGVSVETKHERFALIRDVAARMGVYNASLIAGIAMSETNLAHCQTEAPYACPGPPSPSCNNGPVIAGAADGPCSAMQGGLGMFQFDAGTYADTLAQYGPSVLTLDGNAAQAVAFVLDKITSDVPGVQDWLGAAAWLNSVPLAKGQPAMEQWADLLACRYNGCCTHSSTCQTRAASYRDNALAAYNEMGPAFWHTATRCMQLPADGVIDPRSTCYLAAGDPRHRRRQLAGYAGAVEWADASAAAAPDELAQWTIKVAPGRYRVDIHLDGAVGRAKQAHYEVAHAGKLDTVTIDQTSAVGFVALGAFDFAGSGDEHVALGDNTGESNVHVAFDAVRIAAP
ncbi:MAG TPA: hypothetical protein VGG28_27565 [Kofleriaceae bacterium]